MSFKPNDKVVCIDDSPARTCPELRPLSRGLIYCVEALDTRTPILGLILSGVPSTEPHIGWIADRFRKVSDVQAENREARKNRQLSTKEGER